LMLVFEWPFDYRLKDLVVSEIFVQSRCNV